MTGFAWKNGSEVGSAHDDWLTASEQLYFRDAPLAHVVMYEQRLRAARLRFSGRRVATGSAMRRRAQF